MKTVIANWKSNPNTTREAEKLAGAVEKSAAANNKTKVVVAPPFVYLPTVGQRLRRAVLGAQNVYWNEGGAYTGEVNLAQLKNLGVKSVIIGHSERREYFKETDEQINRKVLSALRFGLEAILCVGNKEKMANPAGFVNKQLMADLKGLSAKDGPLKLVVAYEPIWAIGTGDADDPLSAAQVSAKIKEQVQKINGASKVRVLYGGSVNGVNAGAFLERDEIDGVLVGGSSLSAKEFEKIIKTANNFG
ncbi:MAG: triose-phosphate isomerase [Patescibacteria group bacterium]|nr:triose-phosphate isomerase [Patescibacteria group bacterium]